MKIRKILNNLLEAQNLTSEQAFFMIEQIMNGELSNVLNAALLTALRTKGESVEEIYGAIQAMRSNMNKIEIEQVDQAVDTCGTGGDDMGTFNISTAVALVLAGAGVTVVKHGNKAASSKCGSADVLEKLGVNLHLSFDVAVNIVNKIGIVFLFAPIYHPSMKNVVSVRKELGVRTIFNFLGPFCNPASVKRQIIGVPSKEIAEKLAQVALLLKYKHIMIVTNADGMDEIGLSSETHVYEIVSGRISEFIINPQKLGFTKYPLDRITGGQIQDNAKILKNLLSGEGGAKRDIVVLNAAYALIVTGKVKTPEDGMKMAIESIDSGKALEKLSLLIEFSNKYA
jgi:anthranilate phosphoribosyltransferase